MPDERSPRRRGASRSTVRALFGKSPEAPDRLRQAPAGAPPQEDARYVEAEPPAVLHVRPRIVYEDEPPRPGLPADYVPDL